MIRINVGIVRLLFALFLHLMIYQLAFAQEDKPIIFAGDQNHPPFEYLQGGKPSGLFKDFLEELSKAMGRTIELQLGLWKESQQRVLNGDADVLTIFGPSEERRKLYDFSEPIFPKEFTLFVRSDSLAIHSIDDLKGKKVGVTKGGFSRQVLEKENKIQLIFIENNLEGFNLLLSGNIDAVAESKWVGAYTLQKKGLKGIKFIEKPFATTVAPMAVKKGNRELLDELNQGIRKLKEAGTINQITKKWSSQKIVYFTQETIQKIIISAVIVSLLVMIVAGVLWIVFLRRLVRGKTKSLQEEKKFIDNIISSMVDILIVVNPDVTIRTVNKATLNLLGYQEQELIGKSIGSIIEEEQGTFSRTGIERLIKQEVVRNVEMNCLSKDGRRIPMLFSGSVMREEDGQIQGIVCIIHDITERKKAEKKIIEERQRLFSLFDTLPAFVYLQAPDYSIRFANKYYKEHFGETDGKPCYQSLWGRSEPCEVCPTFKVFETKEPQIWEWDSAPDGCIYEINDYPFKDIDGTNLVLELGIDITERKKTEKEIRKIQKLESIGVLAGGIAHDFNNILAAARTNIYMSKAKIDRKSSEYKLLESVENSLLRATTLTQQLLTFAKGGAPVKETTSIIELIKEAADFALSGGNAKCKYNIADNLWLVEVDIGQIYQVIHNLILNAKQSMPDAGTIRIFAENYNFESGTKLPLQEGKYVRIGIQDQGVGIAEEHLQKIFDPYFTTKEMGQGLGLAIVYSIIKNHNGYISVESVIGAGTTFTIYILAAEEQIKEEKLKEKKTIEDTVVSVGEKILLMDDEEIIRESMGQLLTLKGYEVECAKDGDEAIALYKKAMETSQPFDAVILDLTIRGGMGGKETIKKLIEIDPDVKAIVASGYSNDPVLANFEAYGFTDVFNKASESGELLEALNRVLER